MTAADRTRWDEKYARGDCPAPEPAASLRALEAYLPSSGFALDVAGGAGRNAVWLAQRGLHVTVADQSPVGLSRARELAAERGVALRTVETDLETAPFPTSPVAGESSAKRGWDLIISTYFLWRPLFAHFPVHLAGGGTLIVVQPTRRNLERHARPPAAFLLDEGELPQLVPTLDIVHFREEWTDEGRHEAWLVARHHTSKPPQ